MNNHHGLLLLAGTSGARLAARVSQHLEQGVGRCFVEHFPDAEINVRIDEPVRGRDVFLIQPTSPPVSENLFELLAFVDACRRSAARSITAVVPYFGYARSDKRHGKREPVLGSMIAELLEAVGVTHLLTLDLHAPQIEGFFHIPVDTLTALPLLAAAVKAVAPRGAVVVSPDEGRFKAATQVARWLRTRVVVLHKQRESGASAHVVKVVGDVKDEACIIIDDIISTGATIAAGVEALVAAGARPEIFVAATHGVFANGVQQRLQHPTIKKVFVTDSVPFAGADWPQLVHLSVGRLISSAIHRLCDNQTMAELYTFPPGVIDTLAARSVTVPVVATASCESTAAS